MKKEKANKQVSVANGSVAYRKGGEQRWSMPLSEIRVVGELTLPADLMSDDYFLVLVGTESWFLVPLALRS